ncbi:hypothetical protein [Mesorhizobium sp.]|uniref:hypothetical protein n=1 Tax=Mesorhizobium sp. TaxID=1871066 RepID=UPI00122607DC|nr:hypothetical protein [Mesorhizobium sp.]TIO62976.1 MAG: hypothetical protein E5X79_01535 [Mesorhizobium sp.]
MAAFPQRRHLPAPPGVHPDLARLVEALARQAARDDYAARQQDNDDEASGTLRPLFQRSSD